MNDKDYKLQKTRVKKIFDAWRKRMGMGWFHFEVEYYRVYDEDNRSTLGKAFYSNWMYRQFEIHFYLPATQDTTDDSEIEDMIVHELVHCITAPLACNMSGTDTNDEYRRNLIEQTTDIITKGFVWVFEAGQENAIVKTSNKEQK